MSTEWAQKTVTLQSKPRGCHVVTKELYKLVPEINEFDIGMANIWRAIPLLSLWAFSSVQDIHNTVQNGCPLPS